VLGGAVEAQDGVSADRPAWRRGAAGALLLFGSLLLALDFLHAWQAGVGPNAYLAFDTYQYFYHNMLHAARAVGDGGRGLFWNPLQHTGQPFFGIGSTATLYPPHWLFLWLDADVALRAVVVFHLVVAGVGAFALCRELGASLAAAIAGAIAFELGNATLAVTAWMPIVAAPYVWMPFAMLYCERILRAPSLGVAIRLGFVLAVSLLAGFPQTVLFTAQLIGLRFVWELISRRLEHPARALAALGAGLLLPLLLDAVQLLPAIETARASVRGAALSAEDMASSLYSLNPSRLAVTLGARRQVNAPLVLVPAMIAVASLVAPRTRRVAAFYAVTGLAYFVLAFGEATPLFSLYRWLPLGALFRAPVRFLWVTGFCLAVLAGLGVDALTRPARGRDGRTAALAAGAAATALAGLWLVSLPGLATLEWILGAAVIGAGLIAALAARARCWAAAALIAALCLNLAWFRTPGAERGGLVYPVRPVMVPRLLSDGRVLRAEAATFVALRQRATPQDRIYPVYRSASPSFSAKTAALFGLPSAFDYEPQPSRRLAEYSVMMRYGRELKRIDEYYGVLGGTIPSTFRRRLLDLTASRFLVVAANAEKSLALLQPPPLRIGGEGNLAIYENPLALPRALYVPRLEVVADPRALLRRLGEGDDDFRRVTLVEQAPPSGFTGSAGNEATGEVVFVRNDPEHVVLRVRAPERGFVHLADQYADGWRATVAGEDAAILRANYLFRAVEVPAGESTIEMRYTAPGLWAGAAISLATACALLAYATTRRRAAG
jgi:hypothetical protein